MRIDLFFTAGHTEVGELKNFLRGSLRDSFPGVEFELKRRFPAVVKPGPKVVHATPVPGQSGVSGRALERAMVKEITKYGSDADEETA